MKKYALCVGNLGIVELPDCRPSSSRELYHEYVQLSKDGYGRIAGEDVALLEDGEPILEYSARLGEE